MRSRSGHSVLFPGGRRARAGWGSSRAAWGDRVHGVELRQRGACTSKTPPGRPFPELSPLTGLNSGLILPLNSTSNPEHCGGSEAPLCLSFHNCQPKTTPHTLSQDSCRRVTASGKAPGRSSLALGRARHAWPLPRPAVSVHPRTGNVHRFPIQCLPHRGLPWSVSLGGQRMVGGCVGGSYRLQGFHTLFPSLSPQTQTTNPQTGAPEVTQPCLRLHSGHQKLFFETPLVPTRDRQGRPHRGAFSRDSTREGLPWQRLLGVLCGADGCVSTRVVLHCLLPDTRPFCFLGGPGVLSTPGGGGAQ